MNGNFFRKQRELFRSKGRRGGAPVPAPDQGRIHSLSSSIKGGIKAKTFLLLFLVSLLLTQGFGLFFSARMPVFANVPEAVSVAQGSSSTFQLMQQGRKLYEEGKYSEAAAILQQAVAAFKSEGDALKSAMALSNLCLVYQQTGAWAEAEAAIKESLTLLQSEENVSDSNQEQKSERLKILAQALDIQGRLQLSLAKPDQAFNTWQQAEATYAQVNNEVGVINSRLNQAQALQNLGFYPRACKALLNALGIDNQNCQISDQQLQTLKNQPDSLTKAVALRSLGDILQLVGDLQESTNVLNLSLATAERLQSPSDISATLFSLGNTTRAQRNISTNQSQTTQTALDYYQQAANASSSPTATRIQALLNWLSLLIEANRLSDAQGLWPIIQSELRELPASRIAVYARINLAESLFKLSVTKQAAQLLSTALQQAKDLGDSRATSYALGNLGAIYEKTGQLSNAEDLTNQALLLAQTINAPDIAYRWQWQLGRLLKAQNKTDGAIAAYNSATDTLTSLRKDLVNINPDVQFSFRENVEPVYREFVGLLLQSDKSQNKENLAQARKVIESLQQAELVNFFREDCLNSTPIQIDQIDTSAAVIYPIVLEDRLEIVLSLPKNVVRHYTISRKRAEVEDVFARLRKAISPTLNDPTRGVTESTALVVKVPKFLQGVLAPFITNTNRGTITVTLGREATSPREKYLPLAQQVYEWLIRPAEQDIAASEAKTLVFVLDGPMLNLPMAVLHDGNQFLVEKYAIAYTPGLQLLDSKPLPRGKITALKAGLSEPVQGFAPLPFVEDELQQIRSAVPGELLLNQDFTSTAIQKEINSVPFPVVHLATHGQFSSNIDDTFILTWDDRMNVNQLSERLRAREDLGRGVIELLVLSACQTAAGDKRAALGLAGFALKAGARSTLATLWFVNDEATSKLMVEFYRELTNTELSKGEALRRAQVKLLKNNQYQEPVYWAPFVLVGNWL